MSRILIADDEPAICRAFEAMLARDGHSALIAADGHEAVTLAEREQPDAAFLDVRMPGLDGLHALERIRSVAPGLPVIVMTAYGTMDTALSAVRNGAFDYLGKPLELDRVREVLQRALRAADEQRRTEPAPQPEPQASAEPPTDPALIGQGPAMQQLYKLMALLTDNDMTVLILGESGVGKELVARGLHRNGPRAAEPFVAINCAAIPEALLESELFGHARGAFTGAQDARTGRFAAAGAGTLLLDEIGELPLALQGKLLRVLQERRFEPVGEHRSRPLQARVLAATNRDLDQEVAAGRFREDLYHRINPISLHIPPLRQRREDIPLLARHFVARAAVALGRPAPTFTDDALAALSNYAWPGNVRELEHLIKRAALLTPTQVLTAGDLTLPPTDSSEIPAPDSAPSGAPARLDAAVVAMLDELLAHPGTLHSPYAGIVERVEQALVREALSRCGDNQVAASKLLGVHRSTLRKKAGLG